jgi:broad specificity phosphatase PhoE
MAEIYLVRHGQASLGSDNYDQLSKLGQQQAQWLGEYFKQQNIVFDRIVSGTLKRHQQTVEGIGQGLEQTFDNIEQLTEVNEFDFHHLSQKYVEQHPAQALRQDASSRDFFRLLKKALYAWSADEIEGPLNETWQQFNHRVAAAIKHLKTQHHGQRVLLVSSGGVIANLVTQTLKADASSVIELNLQTKNTGLSHFVFNEKSLRLTSFNNTPHLDSPQRRQFITFA